MNLKLLIGQGAKMNNLENQAILLGAKLTEIAIRNTTETIINKVSAVKAKKDDKETINVLEEIINFTRSSPSSDSVCESSIINISFF